MRTYLPLAALLLLMTASLPAQNPLGNPPHTVDDLILIEGADALLRGARAEGVAASGDGTAVELESGVASGSLYLAPVRPAYPFNEVLPSWNGHVTGGGGFRVWMRALREGYESPWFDAGTWGNMPDEPASRKAQFPGGKYDVDVLLLEKPADALELRIDLVRGKAGAPSPRVRLVALSVSNSTGDRRLHGRLGDSRPQVPEDLKRLRSPVAVEVPYRSQVVDRKEWIGRICSPVSVNMALGAYGIEVSGDRISEDCLDPVSDIFGVWHRSVQGAAQHGLRGYVRRYRNFAQVREDLAKGYVICASIRFAEGELGELPRTYAQSTKQWTTGHIIVVKGLAPNGYAIVHDSASRVRGVDDQWRLEDLAKAWFDKGGVAYVFTGRAAGAGARRTAAAR